MNRRVGNLGCHSLFDEYFGTERERSSPNVETCSEVVCFCLVIEGVAEAQGLMDEVRARYPDHPRVVFMLACNLPNLRSDADKEDVSR